MPGEQPEQEREPDELGGDRDRGDPDRREPSSHHAARLREWVFDGRIVPAVCQPRIATPEMIAAGIPTPSPIARMTPMAVSTTAMRC